MMKSQITTLLTTANKELSIQVVDPNIAMQPRPLIQLHQYAHKTHQPVTIYPLPPVPK